MNGATQLGVYETFEDLFGRRSTLNELVADLKPFTRESVLWICAVIVTGMQLWARIDLQPFDVYRKLLSVFFDAPLYSRFLAGYWSSNPKRILFHRRQVLLIAKLAIQHCSSGTLDARTNPGRFGHIFLKANDQFHYGLLEQLASKAVASRDDYAKIITEMIAVGENASPHIAHLIARSHLLLEHFANELRDDPDFVDIGTEHQTATGLELKEFAAITIAIHSRFGMRLAARLFQEPGILPLREGDFSVTALSYDKVRSFIDSVASDPHSLKAELDEKDNGPNDFTIFRKFPLVQQFYDMHLRTAWCGFLMMDNLFLLEKIHSGPYWNANAKFGLKLRKFWGAVFELYVNELMNRSCANTNNKFIPDPRDAQNPNIQICDGIVIADDAMVLMEYKSSMFRADTKYSGNHSAIADEIEKKLVHDKEAGQKKGVWQLCESISKLFGQRSLSINNVDLSKIRFVYPFLLTLDSIGGTIGMSPFLNTYFDERLDREAFRSVTVQPLFCTDIQALEVVSGLFKTKALSDILKKWFITNPSLATPLLAIDLGPLPLPENDWLQAEWKKIFKGIVAVLFPDRDPDAALAEAIRRGEQWNLS